MRKQEQKQIIELTDSLLKMHRLLKSADLPLRLQLLTSCQETAVTLGSFLEKGIGTERPEVVIQIPEWIHMLEEYCERVYEDAEKEIFTKEDMGVLDDIISGIQKHVKATQAQLRVAFYPYKAEMWDSLESIYFAAAEDPEVQTVVVPVPYYEKDTVTGQWLYRYDGERFPGNISVTNYQDYDVCEDGPDIAYIHYPYDDYNPKSRVIYTQNIMKS